MMKHFTKAVAAIASVAAAVTLSSCSTADADVTVAVIGTDTECSMSESALAAGNIGFDFTNESGKVNELYVVQANGDIVGEVENVTTGTSRTLTADLVAGDYLVRCKPGQSGDGIETPFTVTGDGGTPQAVADRTVAFKSVEFGYSYLDVGDITVGETIRFEMQNDGSQAHEFEVLDPDGNAIGEVASTEPDATGGATVTFDSPGVYTYRCILIDDHTGKKHNALGMKGTFVVTEI